MLKPRGKVTTYEEYIKKIIIPFVINKAAIYKRVDIVFDVYLSKTLSGHHMAVTTNMQISEERLKQNRIACFSPKTCGYCS